MKSRLIAGIAAVVLALVGAMMVYTYANGAEARAVEDLDPISVLVVQQPVPAGTPVSELGTAVAATELPATAVADTALKDLNSSEGKVTAVDLVVGEQLVTERLVDPSEVTNPGTVEVPEGLQEVSFQVEPQRVAGGRVQAGDYVGIFVSMTAGGVEEDLEAESTQLVLQRILVTGVQRASEAAPQLDPNATEEERAAAEAEALPSGSLMLTVAVNADQATRLVFANEFEAIYLSKMSAETPDAPPFIVHDKELYR
ncbi:hypothetical protein GCM10027403_01860 [Arthrobacter tecti]